jgi:hypothetical protein
MGRNVTGAGRPVGGPVPRRGWLAGVRGNPLARPTDRWQARLRVLLITLGMLMLPLAATVGSLVTADGLHVADVQARDRSSTVAVLTADAPALQFTEGGAPVSTSDLVAVDWFAPEGSPRTGALTAAPGMLAGSTMRIWVDHSGNLVGAPTTSSAAVTGGVVVGVGMILSWGLVLILVLGASGVVLDRKRRADWDRDWARVAPIWLRR